MVGDQFGQMLQQVGVTADAVLDQQAGTKDLHVHVLLQGSRCRSGLSRTGLRLSGGEVLQVSADLGAAQGGEGANLQLADALARDTHNRSHLLQRPWDAGVQPVA